MFARPRCCDTCRVVLKSEPRRTWWRTFVVYGERVRLDAWWRTDEFEAFVFELSACLMNPGVIPGVPYAAAQKTMDRRAKAVGAR